MIYFRQVKACVAFAQVGEKLWENEFMHEMCGTGQIPKSCVRAVGAKFILQQIVSFSKTATQRDWSH